jgi:5-methylthioadenosine/S-adenosylhomocysteine deaminase
VRAPDDATPLLLEGAHVLTVDAGRPRFTRDSVCIADGIIRAVGPARVLSARFPGARRLSCRGRVLLPGLVNAHLHPDLHVLRGSLERKNLHEWNTSPIFNPAVEILGTEEGRALQHASIRASFAEAALSGTTCIGAYGVSDGALEVCADLLAALGLRGAVVARDDTFSRADAALQRGGFTYPVFYRLHAEETLTHAELERAAAAHEGGARIIMHAAETRHRARLAQERFGTSTVRLLHRYGLLSPRTLLSHVTFIDDEEIALIARHRVPVVLSAAAEMKLGDGTPPAIPLLEAGVTVALGTDAAVCSDGTDMLLEMRAFGWQQKLRYGAAAIGAEEILVLATRGGPAALGLERAGSIEAGNAADLVLIDAASPRCGRFWRSRTGTTSPEAWSFPPLVPTLPT